MIIQKVELIVVAKLEICNRVSILGGHAMGAIKRDGYQDLINDSITNLSSRDLQFQLTIEQITAIIYCGKTYSFLDIFNLLLAFAYLHNMKTYM